MSLWYMDGTPGFATTSAAMSKGLCKVVDYADDGVPDLRSPGVPSSSFSMARKRKWSFIDESSLVLGLGHLSSSCISICSGKVMEAESSINLDLSINFNRGGHRISNQKMAPAGASNALEVRTPKLDLELSLSTGCQKEPKETLFSARHMEVVAGASILDEEVGIQLETKEYNALPHSYV